MYDEGQVLLPTNTKKEDFLLEFGFWFPGESDQILYEDPSMSRKKE